jgi:hypothetical protein
MCHGRVMVRSVTQLAVVTCPALALAQLTDSLDTSQFRTVGIDSARLDFPNQSRNAAILTAQNLLEIPDWDETVILNLRILN